MNPLPAPAPTRAVPASEASRPLLSPTEVGRLLGQGPLLSLLTAFEDQTGVGWLLKDAATLQYVQWRGSLPQLDPALCAEPEILAGQTDASLFERSQANLLRLSDLRAIQQAGRPSSEDHRFETLPQYQLDSMREWRAWRWAGQGYLLVVWSDRGVQARQDERLAQAQQQIQAQQLLISRLQQAAQGAQRQPELQEEAARSLAWAGEQFATQLRREVDLSQREHRSVALLFVEISQGAQGQEWVPTATGLLAQILSAGTRVMDTVAQVGDRRFGVILSGASLAPAHSRAEALRRHAATHQVLIQGAPSALEVSIGLAVFPHSAKGAEALTTAALTALQEALQAGSSCTVISRVEVQPPPLSST